LQPAPHQSPVPSTTKEPPAHVQTPTSFVDSPPKPTYSIVNHANETARSSYNSFRDKLKNKDILTFLPPVNEDAPIIDPLTGDFTLEEKIRRLKVKLEEKPVQPPPSPVQQSVASLNLKGSQKSVKSMGLTPRGEAPG